MPQQDIDLSYILNQLGEERGSYYNAVAPPLVQTSNFAFDTVADLRYSVNHEMEVPVYTRGNNPTVEILRKKLAALEGAEDCLVFASGAAAISAAVMSNVQAGDHVICVDKPYGWATKLLTEYLARFGVTHTFVDGRDVENFRQAILPNTKVIYLESPNSITLELQDLQAVSALAKAHNIVTIIDNTYCTSLLQRPIAMGIDIVLYSGTKYHAGHSDVVAGIVCGSKAYIEKLFQTEYMNIGGIISPLNAWLMIRSLRTLPLRLQASGKGAAAVADFLASRPEVEQLIYPMHPSFPQYALAQQQMKGASGILSILLKADNLEQIERFANALDRFLIAVSWGGHESLVLPVSGLVHSPAELHPTLPWNLVRFYIGLEDPAVLIENISQSLENYRH
jgi:cystathionine beta-lyase/cystathionine gamma-synthase